MRYYKLFTETPICGTDETELIASETEFEIDEDEIKQDLYDSYGYLINGWGYVDPTEEEAEDFMADCTVLLDEITEEEFEELAEDGYCIRRV